MTAPPEKHMLAASALRNAVQWQSNGSIETIAQALANAEREGMKRAAEIAIHLNGWGNRDGTAEHIAKVILSEAGENTDA